MSSAHPFADARWIWSERSRKNQFVLFSRSFSAGVTDRRLHITIYASYHYELYINGSFINRGPVHGDPAWCLYDELDHILDGETRQEIVILGHHSSGTYLHHLTEAPAGLIARFETETQTVETGSDWQVLDLECWSGDVDAKNWALGYCEDYDARLEPSGFAHMRFDSGDDSWRPATVIDGSTVWSGFTPRITPYLTRMPVRPIRFSVFSAPGEGTDRIFDASYLHDTEPLETFGEPVRTFSTEALGNVEEEANAFTFDLGCEHVGFYAFEIEADPGVTVEVSGAELLQPGPSPEVTSPAGSVRPWVFRKGTCYSARFVTAGGKRVFRTFSWSGFRYLHIVLRKGEANARLLDAYCLSRGARSVPVARPRLPEGLDRIYDICERTLAIAGQEFHSDCPTREQAAAWLDGLVSTAAALVVYGDDSYIRWLFEAFIHAPLDEFGLINGRYPGTIGRWVDMCLHPILTHAWYRRYTGRSYSPGRMIDKALVLKRWYDAEIDDRGIIDFDFKSYFDRGLRTFIDHPGLSMHDADHRGIDRGGASCALNAYFLMFLDELIVLAEQTGRTNLVGSMSAQALRLREAIKRIFFDGEIFHDCETAGSDRRQSRLSEGTSWQTNSIAVCAGIVKDDEARKVMQRMIDGYDELCRSTPGTALFFIRALHLCGMDAEAEAYIAGEWGYMCDQGASTCWETFLGNEKDSLCHPWGVSPLLFFHDAI